MRRQANANIKQDTLLEKITSAVWKIIKCFQHSEVKIKHVGQTDSRAVSSTNYIPYTFDNVHKQIKRKNKKIRESSLLN